MTIFGQRLKQSRIENGLTLEDLANKINTTKSAISRYENNLRMPKGDFIKNASDVLNVSTDYLLGKTNIKYSSEIKTLENLKSVKIKTIAIGASKLSDMEKDAVINLINTFIHNKENL